MTALFHEDLGGSGDTLVVVHGYTGSSDDFRDVCGALTDLRRIVLVDNLGHGRSPRALRYSFGVLTRAIVEFLLLEIREPVDLLGHSMGGRLVAPIAALQPSLVRSLILMNTWLDHPDRSTDADHLEAIFAADDDAVLVALESALATQEPGPEDALIAARHGAAWSETRNARNRERLDPRARVQLGREVYVASESVLAAAADIACPTTIIVGQHDEPFLGPTQRMHAAIAGSSVCVVAGAYHSPQLTHPDEWLACVRRHLESL